MKYLHYIEQEERRIVTRDKHQANGRSAFELPYAILCEHEK